MTQIEVFAPPGLLLEENPVADKSESRYSETAGIATDAVDKCDYTHAQDKINPPNESDSFQQPTG